QALALLHERHSAQGHHRLMQASGGHGGDPLDSTFEHLLHLCSLNDHVPSTIFRRRLHFVAQKPWIALPACGGAVQIVSPGLPQLFGARLSSKESIAFASDLPARKFISLESHLENNPETLSPEKRYP